MFDFWEALKYVIKEKISQFKLGVRRFFCKHHYVRATIRKVFFTGTYEVEGVKCTKCGKIAEKEEWMTIYLD